MKCPKVFLTYSFAQRERCAPRIFTASPLNCRYSLCIFVVPGTMKMIFDLTFDARFNAIVMRKLIRDVVNVVTISPDDDHEPVPANNNNGKLKEKE